MGIARSRSNRRLRDAGLIILLAVLGSLLAATARAATNTVTLEIFHVYQLEDADGDGSDGDYFPEIRIGDGPVERRSPIQDDDFDVDWKFSHSVDESQRFIPVMIRLWDEDGGLAGGDDRMDISPKDQDVEVNLTYDVQGRTWSDDIQGGLTIAEGDGDHDFPETNDGRRARILFDITTGGSTDIDGDGIPDTVERFGVKRPDASTVWVAMDPCRKDILLQLDFMTGAMDGHSHEPKQAAKDEVVAAFNAAPVGAVDPCPYGGDKRASGIGFRFIPGKSTPEKPVMGFDNDYRAARSASFDKELRPYAHYGIFVHDQKAGSSSSGLCCEKEQGNKDIIVSLGSWRDTCVTAGADGVSNTTPQDDDQMVGTEIRVGGDRTCDSAKAGDDVQIVNVGQGAADAFVGTVRDQSGTIMHELGHSLGLGHGGNDPTNNKPNYLSVMNYSFDPGGITIDGAGNSRLDYSRADLPDLNKSALNEGAGIGDGTDFTTWTSPGGVTPSGRGNGPLNWNNSKDGAGLDTIDGGTVNVDINSTDDVCILPGANGELDTDPEGDDSKVGGAHPAILNGSDGVCQTTEDDDDDTGRHGTLTGYDDWQNLKFRATAAVVGAGAAADHGGDIRFPVVLKREIAQRQFFDPDIETHKGVDKADAEPGDDLSYTVEARNIGTGQATKVEMTDAFPDGTSTSRSLADIAAGRSRSETFAYEVPCDTPDGTVLTNKASVSATDLGGSPESNTANNADDATTTVHAPKLTLERTTSSTVDAGEPIAHKLVVSNTGSASASEVMLVDVLPADVYYSYALDQGAGPRPTTVLRDDDGTSVLTWSLGSLADGASTTVEYTARPSLLVLAGTELVIDGTVTYENGNGCTYAPVEASATTTVTEVEPSRDPHTLGYWRTHEAEWTSEMRARIQATDQRFDGADGSVPDGEISAAEVSAVFAQPGGMPRTTAWQLLATYFNLATRRINASTAIESATADRLGLDNVSEAGRYAQDTLDLPVDNSTRTRYSDTTTVLDEINRNVSEVY